MFVIGIVLCGLFFFFSSRRRHTRYWRDWSSDVCSSDLVVSGMLYEDEEVWSEIEEWCRAAGVVRTLRGCRFGFLGHTYPGMLDLYSDFTMHHAQLGLHVEILEMDDLKDHVEIASDDAIGAKVEEARETFELGV